MMKSQHTDTSKNNKRIARNTILLYFRTLIMTCVSLYTSRVILSTLGIVDFGINNVVAGVVSMFTFINSTMSTSTQRYLTFSIGKGDVSETAKIFGMAIRIHLLLGLLVILLCESIGLWMLNAKLVIPEERMFAANCIFQLSLLSFFINVTQVPYNAAIIAHEKMDVYAYISILDVVLKLLIVYSIALIPFDKLITFSVLCFLLTQLNRTIYRIYCKKHFEECNMPYEKDVKLYKEMFNFAAWNLFGSIVWMLRSQGINVVLNLFMGPIVNAARGVAMQVSHAVTNFVNNFTTAVKPQITKNYAQGKLSEMEALTYRGSKFAFFLLFLIAFPLILNIDFVLNLWLKEVPEYTAIFVALILVDSMVHAVFGTPMIASMMATGNIKVYQVVVSSILLGIVPCAYIVLKMGFDAPSVFIVMILFSFLSGVVRYLFCVRQINYSVKRFMVEVIKPIVLVVFVSLPLPMLVANRMDLEEGWERFIVLFLISFLSSSIVSFSIGLTRQERSAIISTIKSKIVR